MLYRTSLQTCFIVHLYKYPFKYIFTHMLYRTSLQICFIVHLYKYPLKYMFKPLGHRVSSWKSSEVVLLLLLQKSCTLLKHTFFNHSVMVLIMCKVYTFIGKEHKQKYFVIFVQTQFAWFIFCRPFERRYIGIALSVWYSLCDVFKFSISALSTTLWYFQEWTVWHICQWTNRADKHSTSCKRWDYKCYCLEFKCHFHYI